MVQSLKVVGVHGQIFLRIAYGPLELEQLPPLNLWDSYITSDPLGPTQGRTKGIGLSVEVLCSKFVPVFFEEFSFSLGHRCRRVGNSYCYRRGFCCRHRALLFFFFFKFYFIFKLYNIVLVLPNIKMNPPQVYPCSPS